MTTAKREAYRALERHALFLWFYRREHSEEKQPSGHRVDVYSRSKEAPPFSKQEKLAAEGSHVDDQKDLSLVLRQVGELTLQGLHL